MTMLGKAIETTSLPVVIFVFVEKKLSSLRNGLKIYFDRTRLFDFNHLEESKRIWEILWEFRGVLKKHLYRVRNCHHVLFYGVFRELAL